jgi:hypothetical protein
MHSGSNSNATDTSSGHSAHTPIVNALPGSNKFSITPKDAEILLEYLEDFENSRKRDCAKVIERAMGEVCQHYTNIGSFDKRDAKVVWHLVLIFMCTVH